MSATTLELHNRAQLALALTGDAWLVACLCAAWCDACRDYRPRFDQLAAQHPDKHFLWIDIEDQADLVGDLDVENFPTLLIQRGETVAFYGTVQPDLHQANLLLTAQAAKSTAELQAGARQDANLLRRLRNALEN